MTLGCGIWVKGVGQDQEIPETGVVIGHAS